MSCRVVVGCGPAFPRDLGILSQRSTRRHARKELDLLERRCGVHDVLLDLSSHRPGMSRQPQALRNEEETDHGRRPNASAVESLPWGLPGA